MESWIYRGEDGAVVWHVENDGYPAVYCGLDPVDIVITSEKFGRGATRLQSLCGGKGVARAWSKCLSGSRDRRGWRH